MSVVPKTQYKKQKIADNTLTNLIYHLVFYHCLTIGVMEYLFQKKRLTKLIEFQLNIEGSFCLSLLKDLMKINMSYLSKIEEDIMGDYDKFYKEVENFAKKVCPDSVNILVTNNIDKEFSNLIKQKIVLNKSFSNRIIANELK